MHTAFKHRNAVPLQRLLRHDTATATASRAAYAAGAASSSTSACASSSSCGSGRGRCKAALSAMARHEQPLGLCWDWARSRAAPCAAPQRARSPLHRPAPHAATCHTNTAACCMRACWPRPPGRAGPAGPATPPRHPKTPPPASRGAAARGAPAPSEHHSKHHKQTAATATTTTTTAGGACYGHHRQPTATSARAGAHRLRCCGHGALKRLLRLPAWGVTEAWWWWWCYRGWPMLTGAALGMAAAMAALAGPTLSAAVPVPASVQARRHEQLP